MLAVGTEQPHVTGRVDAPPPACPPLPLPVPLPPAVKNAGGRYITCPAAIRAGSGMQLAA